MWIHTKRILRSGFSTFWRNSFVSLSSVLVMIVTLFVIGSIIFSMALLSSSLKHIQDKVDINVYMTTRAPESETLALKKRLEALPEISSVVFTSADDALAEFKKRHENDALTIQGLDELDTNPLGATLTIKATDPSHYESIASFLDGEQALSLGGEDIVDRVDYRDNKIAIDALSRIISAGKKLGLIVALVFVLVSLLVTFNTIRLAIYVSREEIGVMRLVGASTGFIRGPFVVTGIMYGITSAIFTLIIFYPVTYWLKEITENFFSGTNVFHYYLANFPQIFAIIILSGVIIGAISSFLAVKRHLTV